MGHRELKTEESNPCALMVQLHSVAAAGSLGSYLFREGRSGARFLKCILFLFLFIHPSLCRSLSLMAFIRPLKSTRDENHKACSLNKSRPWPQVPPLPFPQCIPDRKAIHLMRTTNPKRGLLGSINFHGHHHQLRRTLPEDLGCVCTQGGKFCGGSLMAIKKKGTERALWRRTDEMLVRPQLAPEGQGHGHRT